MTDYAGTILRMKAFDAAMTFGHSSMADLLMDARIAENYMSGADRVPDVPAVDGPTDEIPFTGDGEVVRIREVEVPVAEFDQIKSADQEPKKAATRKAKPAKKPKAVRKTKARDEAPVASQESGSQVPESGDHVPDNDAADPNVQQAA